MNGKRKNKNKKANNQETTNNPNQSYPSYNNQNPNTSYQNQVQYPNQQTNQQGQNEQMQQQPAQVPNQDFNNPQHQQGVKQPTPENQKRQGQVPADTSSYMQTFNEFIMQNSMQENDHSTTLNNMSLNHMMPNHEQPEDKTTLPKPKKDNPEQSKELYIDDLLKDFGPDEIKPQLDTWKQLKLTPLCNDEFQTILVAEAEVIAASNEEFEKQKALTLVQAIQECMAESKTKQTLDQTDVGVVKKVSQTQVEIKGIQGTVLAHPSEFFKQGIDPGVLTHMEAVVYFHYDKTAELAHHITTVVNGVQDTAPFVRASIQQSLGQQIKLVTDKNSTETNATSWSAFTNLFKQRTTNNPLTRYDQAQVMRPIEQYEIMDKLFSKREI